jgi:hypothetical protein
MRAWLVAATIAFGQTAQLPAPLGPGSPPPVSLAERGLAVGERVPTLNLVDQTGRIRNVADLTGPKGLVILFVRSADW